MLLGRASCNLETRYVRLVLVNQYIELLIQAYNLISDKLHIVKVSMYYGQYINHLSFYVLWSYTPIHIVLPVIQQFQRYTAPNEPDENHHGLESEYFACIATTNNTYVESSRICVLVHLSY